MRWTGNFLQNGLFFTIRKNFKTYSTNLTFFSDFGRIIPVLADKAELARIGRYYATESMLVWDPVRERYDADATPSTGTETLFDYYAMLVREGDGPERGDHAVF